MSISDADRKKLQDLLQQAAMVELSTIPIYLYAMYSIKRPILILEGLLPVVSPYTDKAYNLLRSVAIEEMLHLSLVCNLIQSTGGTVNLFDTYKNLNLDYFNGNYSESKGFYPFTMMHRWPNLCLSLGPCSEKLVFGTLMQIELPTSLEPPRPDSRLPDGDFETIGDFYQQIEDLINSRDCDDSDFQKQKPQLPDDYDTYYQVEENQTDSGSLNKINNKQLALGALKTIVGQGEGSLGEYDDQSKKEKAHFFKFVDILDNYDDYLPDGSIWPLPENPASEAWVLEPSYCDEQKLFASREYCLYIISLVFNSIFLYCLGLLNQAYGDQNYTADNDQTKSLNKVFLCMDMLLTPLAHLLVQEPFADGSGNSGHYAPTFEPMNLQMWSKDWSDPSGWKAQYFVEILSEVLLRPEVPWDQFANPEEAKRIVTQTFHIGLRLVEDDGQLDDFKKNNPKVNDYIEKIKQDSETATYDFNKDILPLVSGRDIHAMQPWLDLSQASGWKSNVYTALTTDTYGDKMPMNGPYFSEPELAIVKKFTGS